MLKLKVLNGFYDFVKNLYFTSNQYCFMNEWTSYLFSLFTDLNTNKRVTYNKDNIYYLTQKYFLIYEFAALLSTSRNCKTPKWQFLNLWTTEFFCCCLQDIPKIKKIKWQYLKIRPSASDPLVKVNST